MTLAEIFPKHGAARSVEAAPGPTLDEIRGWPATVDVAAAAGALGCSRSYAYQHIAQGEFPCKVIKLGGRVRIPTASILALLEGGAGRVRRGSVMAAPVVGRPP